MEKSNQKKRKALFPSGETFDENNVRIFTKNDSFSQVFIDAKGTYFSKFVIRILLRFFLNNFSISQKKTAQGFVIFCFWTSQKYFPVLVLFHFVSLHYLICRIDRLDRVSDKSSLRHTVLFFSFWQDRGKQSIKEILQPIITNISPWSFWNILSAGIIWDRSGTENFLGVWDSLKVREFSKFQLLTETRAASEYCSLSDLGPAERVFQNCCKGQNMKQAICIQLLLLSFTGCESPVLSLRGFGYERPMWAKSKRSLRRFRLSSTD